MIQENWKFIFGGKHKCQKVVQKNFVTLCGHMSRLKIFLYWTFIQNYRVCEMQVNTEELLKFKVPKGFGEAHFKDTHFPNSSFSG